MQCFGMHRFAFQYACRIVVQDKLQEEIMDFKEQFKDLLKEFYRNTGHIKPEAIIYYRDGVSESQFDTVLKFEYAQMRQVVTGCQRSYWSIRVCSWL